MQRRVDSPSAAATPRFSTDLLWLVWIAIGSLVIYAAIRVLSFQFQVDTLGPNIPEGDRPLILVLCLFLVAFLFYAFAIRIVNQSERRGGMMKVIIGAAIAFRVVMAFSIPIQEVDIYRYLWDGVVCTQGVSPFRYAPEVVLAAVDDPSDDADLESLAAICRRDAGVAEVLRRVHFASLPTVYPSVSQAVFAVSAWTTPDGASPLLRLRIMKLWLLLFDLGTLGLVACLLSRCRLPPELCISYAWCPLLMKEVANSGHLDSIAVFFATLFFYLWLRVIRERESETEKNHQRAWMFKRLGGAAVVLALAVGAKIYPIVFVPLVAVVVTRRFGWKAVVPPALVFTMVVSMLFSPMLPSHAAVEAGNDPSAGVKTFFKFWEMNDFLFMIVVENLKPVSVEALDTTAVNAPVWFSVLPQGIREATGRVACDGFKFAEAEWPFLVTRLITGLAFALIAVGLAIRSRSEESDADGGEVARICQVAFLTVAWFWLLCPTQNPWYWTWALPFLPFMRNRAWFAVSGLVFLYYSRFWFEYHYLDVDVLGTGYTGTLFFDFVVTWVEFAPWFIWLAVSALLFRKSRREALPSI